jgi:hypothetical protein
MQRSLRLSGLLILVCVAGLRPIGAGEADPSEPLRAELQELTGQRFLIHQESLTAVVTDAPDEVAAACVKHLNQVLPRMRRLARFPNDAPAPDALRIALFSRRADFDKFLRARKAPPSASFTVVDGETPAQRVVVAFVLDTHPLLARLRHVAFVILMRSWFKQPPPWLLMGLGECVEDLTWDAQGVCAPGPARGHLRDLREKVMDARPPQSVPLKDLLRLDRAAFERRGLPATACAWAFVRFLLEDPAMRESRQLQKVLARLSPPGAEAENIQRALGAFPEEELYAMEASFLDYVKKLSETPADDPYRQARAKLDAGDFAAAQRLLEMAVALDPDYERLYYFRAVSTYSQGQFPAAVKDLDQALALFPEYHAARFLRGRCRAALKDAAGARADFEACLDTVYGERAKRELQGLKP